MAERDSIVIQLRKRAAACGGRIALCGEGERTTMAAAVLGGLGFVVTVVAASRQDVPDGVLMITPSTDPRLNSYGENFAVIHGAATSAEATARLHDPLYFAGMMLDDGVCDAVVGGSGVATAHVLRAALYTERARTKETFVSSSFLMITSRGVYTFSDCAVVPEPTPEQLVRIAAAAAGVHKKLADEAPRVAFLSFSTKGSAIHPRVDAVRRAYEQFVLAYPDIACDGELQLDAAIIKDVARQKLATSSVAGSANVLIFPDLNAGNIGYKLVERFADARAIGPLLSGFSRPWADLSRGCSADDIVDTACATILLVNGDSHRLFAIRVF